MKKLIYILFLGLYTITACASEKQGQTLTEYEKQFFEQLKKSVFESDKAWIANSASYPLRINVDDSDEIINSKTELLSRYDNLFGCNVRFAIKQQSTETLFKNWSGVMVGSGEIWFIETMTESGDIKLYITSIQKVKQYSDCNQ